MTKIVKTKKIIVSLDPSSVIKKIKSKFTISDDDVKQSIIEESAGSLSSSAIVAVFALATGGGIAVFAHPIVGTIIFTISIIYGSYIKVYAGKFYQKKIKKNKIHVVDETNLEEALLNLFKKHSAETNKIIPYIRSKTSNYTLVKIKPDNNVNLSPKNKSNKIILKSL